MPPGRISLRSLPGSPRNYALALLVALAGCGGGDEPAGGYHHIELKEVSFDYPTGFEADRAGTGEGIDELLDIKGPPAEDGLYIRVTLRRERREGPSTARREGRRIATRRPSDLPKGRAVEDGPVEVTGAEGGRGWRVVTAFTTSTDAGSVPARLTELIALSPGYRYTYSVVGPERMLDKRQVERILGSLRFAQSS